MKHRYLMQLFGEDGGETAPETTGQENSAEGTEGAEEGAERMYTAAEVDAIVSKRLKRWEAQQQRAVDEAAKLAAMTEQQRTAYERDQLQAQVDEYKRRDARATMAGTVRQMLAQKGISGISDSLVGTLVTEEAESTTANVEAFAAAYSAAITQGIAAQIATGAPKTGTSASTLTKEDIEKVKNRAERQRLIRENMDLFQRKD